MITTRLGLSGFSRPPYGSFADKTATEVDLGAGAPSKTYWHTLPNGLRVKGSRDDIEEAIRRYDAVQRSLDVVTEPAKPAKPAKKSKVLPDEAFIAAEMEPVTVPEIARKRDKALIQRQNEEDAIIALLLA